MPNKNGVGKFIFVQYPDIHYNCSALHDFSTTANSFNHFGRYI